MEGAPVIIIAAVNQHTVSVIARLLNHRFKRQGRVPRFGRAVELVGGPMRYDDKVTLFQTYRFFRAFNFDQAIAPMGEMKARNIFELGHFDAPGRCQGRAEIQRTAHGQVGEDVTQKIKHGLNIHHL